MLEENSESFAEAEVMLEQEDEVSFRDSEIDSEFKGFARLNLCDLVEYEDETEYGKFTKEYIVIKATIHDEGKGIVLFQEYADLYKYAIEYTESDNLNQISGKYIPVDRIQGNVYKPSSTLFDIIDSHSLSKWSYNFKRFGLEETVLSDKIKRCIEYGYVGYNLDKGIWEIKESIRLRIMALDFRSASFGALLFPFLTVFVLVGLTYVPIDIDPILTVLSFKQFVYVIAGVCLLLCVLIPFTFLKLAQLFLLQIGSKSRCIPI